MIKVNVDTKLGHVDIVGHAQKDRDTGVSLVCCAVSAIFYFLAASADYIDVDKGILEFDTDFDLNMIISGFEQLQGNFPDEILLFVNGERDE